jgi:hypothetical protein
MNGWQPGVIDFEQQKEFVTIDLYKINISPGGSNT